MTHSLSSLSDLLNNAGTQWRVFDMGRKITKIDKATFAKIESTHVPYPYPLQQHAFIAIQFWNKAESTTPYIWFLKFPLDEQSKLVSASRDHFASLVLEALGTQLTEQDGKSDQLNNNPYVFTPNANKRAAFNALMKVELNQAASQYYEHAALYLSGKIGFENWSSVALQGLADFAFRLSDENQSHLINALPQLPDEVLNPLSAMLEHVSIDVPLTEALITQIKHAISTEDIGKLTYFLRMIASSKAQGLVDDIITSLLKHPQLLDLNILMTLAGRCWISLVPHMSDYFEIVSTTQSSDVFAGIFADLVAIDVTRPHVLALLRDQSRSDVLSKAIGQLFSS